MRDKSMASLTALPTDVMINQRLDETVYGAPSWEALLHFYAGELMALAVALVLIVLFAWRARAAQQAIRSAQSKADCLAVISHEIRTPMQAILSAVELLRRSQLDRSQQELMTIAGAAADALLGLLDDVLDWSKLDADRLELERMPTDMVALVQAAIGMVSIRAQEKGVPILLESQIPANIDVGVDPTRIRQVILNLLSNAVKFTERGSIRVDLRLLGATNAPALQVTVQDTGIGIPPEQQERLFNPFTQADRSTTRRYGGTGLGLTICRQLIELMHGTLVLQSDAGAGTAVRFTISVTTQERQLATPAGNPRQAGALAMRSPGQPAPTILVVDDHPANRLVLRHQLEQLGCAVVLAENGPAALALLAQRQFQLVLLDCYMAGKDGYQVAREIRMREAGSQRRTAIVAISAAVDPAHRQRCHDAGMDAVLKKPLRLQALKKLIEAWCDVDLSPSVPAAAPGTSIDVELQTVFRESAQQDLAKIRKAMARADRRAMAAYMHRMKGAATLLGFSAIAEACGKFEHTLQSSRRANATHMALRDSAYAELCAQVALLHSSHKTNQP